MNEFSHINKDNQPKMVNVGGKEITKRKAIARAQLFLGTEIISRFTNNDIVTKKGAVFQTAIIAGIQAVKKNIRPYTDVSPFTH